MATKNNSIISPEYLNFKDEITARIGSAQYEAPKAVNRKTIAFLQPLVAEIDRSKHIVILTKCKEVQQQQFYILATKKYGWTKYLHRAIFSVARKMFFGDKTSMDMASQYIERDMLSVADRRKDTSRCIIQSEVRWKRSSCA